MQMVGWLAMEDAVAVLHNLYYQDRATDVLPG